MNRQETADVFDMKRRIETLERQMSLLLQEREQAKPAVNNGVFTRDATAPQHQKPQRTAEQEREYMADRFG